jgi:hypothetical protein
MAVAESLQSTVRGGASAAIMIMNTPLIFAYVTLLLGSNAWIRIAAGTGLVIPAWLIGMTGLILNFTCIAACHNAKCLECCGCCVGVKTGARNLGIAMLFCYLIAGILGIVLLKAFLSATANGDTYDDSILTPSYVQFMLPAVCSVFVIVFAMQHEEVADATVAAPAHAIEANTVESAEAVKEEEAAAEEVEEEEDDAGNE